MIVHFLITGATGFIGRRLTHHVITRGWKFTALVRNASRRAQLAAPPTRVVECDLATDSDFSEPLQDVDCVLHLAGVTKAVNEAGYFRTNAEGTRRICEAIAALPQPPRLVYCSSLAAAGPAAPDQPRSEQDPPVPISAYGRSKLAGEQALRDVAHRVPGLVIRPPIVYGPGDREFLPTLRTMVRCGALLTCGAGPRLYSLIHVDDLCAALLAAAERGTTLRDDDPVAGVYTVSDGVDHDLRDIGADLARALGHRPPRVVPIPSALVRLIAWGSELNALRRGQVPMLNRDKVREAQCQAWTCTTERAMRDLGFRPTVMWPADIADALRSDPTRGGPDRSTSRGTR